MSLKKFFLVASFLFTLVACNSVGSKEELVARIGSEKIYMSDLEFLQKRQAIAKNTPQFGVLFNETILDEAIAAYAKSVYPGITKLVQKDIEDEKVRFLTIVFQQFHVMEKMGFSQHELEEYYKAHADEFTLDSSQTFNDIRKSVAEKLYLERNADSLDRYIQKVLPTYSTPEKVEFLYAKNPSLDLAIQLEDQIKKAENLEKITSQLSLEENSNHPLLQIDTIKKLLFGAKAMDLNAPPQTVSIGDTLYYTVQVLNRTKREEAVLEQHRETIHKAFINLYFQDMMQNSLNRLKEKYKVELIDIDSSQLQKYYQENLESFQTLAGYQVYQIENSDSLLLQREVASKTMSLEEFRAKAELYDQNKFTKNNKGFVGHIKKTHSLPYGIGLLPSLFEAFEGKPEGTISPVLKAPNTNKFHVFYLEKEMPSTQKSFDRVKASIKSTISKDFNFKFDSAMVVATANSQVLLTEKNIQLLKNEIPVHHQSAFPREKLIQILLQWELYAKEAKALNLDKSWEFKAFVRQANREYSNKYYRDSLKQYRPENKVALENIYNRYASFIKEGASFEDLAPVLLVFLKTPENVFKHEYYLNPNRYQSFANLEDAKGLIFKNIASIEERNQWKRLQKDVWNTYNITVFKENLPPLKKIGALDSLIDAAESFYQDRDLENALTSWDLVRSVYPENDSAFKNASFEIASIKNELENYVEAAAEFRVFYDMWPSDSKAEKAMFSRAFILSENLKQDSAALMLFKDFSIQYPNSELKESVEWLIQNIESNGKLAEDLVAKINQLEADTVGTSVPKESEQ